MCAFVFMWYLKEADAPHINLNIVENVENKSMDIQYTTENTVVWKDVSGQTSECVPGQECFRQVKLKSGNFEGVLRGGG